MNQWQPVDYVVMTLTAMIAAVFVLTVLVPLFLEQPISDLRSKVLAGLATSVVSVISVYVGAKMMKQKKGDDE